MAVVVGRPPPFRGTPVFGALPFGVVGSSNIFILLRVAGLLPRGGLTSLLIFGFFRVFARTGAVGLAARMAIVFLRTIGLIQNESGFLPGLPIPSTPLTRLFPSIVGFPFTGGAGAGFNSFLRGAAYRNGVELADGWLSIFGELLLSETAAVDTSVGLAIDALRRLDFVGFGNAAGSAVSNEVGLADLAAFFRGIAESEADFQRLGLPTGSVAPWVFGAAIGAVIFLDAAVTSVGGTVGRLVGEFLGPAFPSEGRPPDIKRPPPGTSPPTDIVIGDLPLDPGLRRGLPVTEEEVREVVKVFGRFQRRLSDFARIIAILKRERA